MSTKYAGALVLMILLVIGGGLHLGASEEHQDCDHDHGAPEAQVKHEEYDDHEGHDHAAHDDHEEAGLRLTGAERRAAGLRMATAGPGSLDVRVRIPGEIMLDADRTARVSPRLSGVVRAVLVEIGEAVTKGQTLAVIESRELAMAKAELIAARERADLVRKSFRREKQLWTGGLTSEESLQEARSALAEAEIEERAAEQGLLAMGVPAGELEDLADGVGEDLRRHRIRAPLAGTVIRREIALGETLAEDACPFTVSNLSRVWVEGSVSLRDLPLVQQGQTVEVDLTTEGLKAAGTIKILAPVVDPITRTAAMRVVLANPDGRWRPGQFVMVDVTVDAPELPVAVEASAVQTLDGEAVVFVGEGDLFEPRPVTVGRRDRRRVEIVAGLTPGEPYVSDGAFALKAELTTRGMDPHAGHGH